MIRLLAAALTVSVALAGTAEAAAGELVVHVTKVRNSHGLVHVDVCPQDKFLKESCPYAVDVPAHAGTTDVVIRGVPPGRYAVQTSHDENANHRVDRGMFGIPREGIGFSNDAPIHFGPPKWNAAQFDYHGGEQAISVTTRYITIAAAMAGTA